MEDSSWREDNQECPVDLRLVPIPGMYLSMCDEALLLRAVLSKMSVSDIINYADTHPTPRQSGKSNTYKLNLVLVVNEIASDVIKLFRDVCEYRNANFSFEDSVKICLQATKDWMRGDANDTCWLFSTMLK